VSAAPNGSTICLNNGNYGTVSLTNITRTGFVTLQSLSGVGAQMRPQITNTDYVKLVSLTLTDMLVQSCSTHIHTVNSTFVPGAPGVYFLGSSSCPGQDLLVDNVSFSGVNYARAEGRLSTQGPIDGLIIRNSFFGNNGYGDGIQIGGGTNIVIGPNNLFDGIRQGYCDANGGAHCDSIQLYGAGPGLIITGNYFKNSEVFIMAPDGSDTITVVNNVFDGFGVSYSGKLQFGTAASPIFRHNTVTNTNVGFAAKSGMPATTNAVVENNILTGGVFDVNGGGGCSGCTFRYNLFNSSTNARGTNNVIGTPIYVGGSRPTSFAGWQLAAGSPGKNAGLDGNDVGSNYYGGVVISSPAAPFNVRILTN
jgi:hypothetical protein